MNRTECVLTSASSSSVETLLWKGRKVGIGPFSGSYGGGDTRHTSVNYLLQVNTVSVLFKGQLVSYLEFDLQGSRALEP